MMQPLDQQGEELFEAQTRSLHLVRAPAGGGVLRPAQALDRSAIHVCKEEPALSSATATTPAERSFAGAEATEASGAERSQQAKQYYCYSGQKKKKNPRSALQSSLIYLFRAKLSQRPELYIQPDSVFTMRRASARRGEKKTLKSGQTTACDGGNGLEQGSVSAG